MPVVLVVFSLTHPTATETYTLSLHDALPIWFRFSSGRDGTPSPTYSVRIAGHVVATRQLAIFATTGWDGSPTKSATYVWPADCHLRNRDLHMVLKIEKVSDGPNVLLRLSGRIESQQVQELKAQIDGSKKKFILDLEHVRM